LKSVELQTWRLTQQARKDEFNYLVPYAWHLTVEAIPSRVIFQHLKEQCSIPFREYNTKGPRAHNASVYFPTSL